MRRDLVAIVSFALAVASAACLPSRDNSFDDKNRPVAAMSVVENAGVGSCSTSFTTADEYPPIGVAHRSTCLALDARASDDPQGDPLTVEFGRLSGTEFVLLSSTAFTPAAGGRVAMLQPGFLAGLPLRETVDFAVRVRETGSGASDVASASVILVNARPVAVLGTSRTLPRGGFPWAPGEPAMVTIDGSGSYDPDGDPITEWCWDFEPDDTGDGCSSDPSAAIVERSVELPMDERRFTATLRISDGDESLVSHRAVATIQIQNPNVFFVSDADTEIGAFVERLDTAVRTTGFEAKETQLLDPSSEYPGGRIFLSAEFDDSYGITVVPLPAFEAPVSYLSPQSILDDLHFAVNRPGTHAYGVAIGSVPRALALGEGPPPAIGVESYLVSGTSISAVGSTRYLGDVDVPTFQPSSLPQFTIAVDDTGNAWVSWRNEDEPAPLVFVPSDLSAPIESLGVEDAFTATGLFPRPGMPEVWITREPLDTQLLVSEIDIWSTGTAGNPIKTGSVPIHGLVRELAWWSNDLLWVATAEEGLFLVEADRLDEPGGIEAIALVAVPAAQYLEHLAVDDVTGTVWGVGPGPTGERSLWEVTADGRRVLSHPRVAENDPLPIGVDAAGTLVQSGTHGRSRTLRKGYSTEASGRFSAFYAEAAPLFGAGPAAFPDAATGGLWISTELLGRRQLALYAADGTLLEVIEEVGVEGTTETFEVPDLRHARLSPDGRYLWFFDEFSHPLNSILNRLDLSVRPPLLEMVSSGVVTAGLYVELVNNNLFEPAVTTAGDPFAWTKYGAQISTVRGDGTITPLLTLSTGFETVVSASLLPASNDLCVVAQRTQATDSYVVLVVSTDGSHQILEQLDRDPAFVPGPTRKILALGHSDPILGDTCWSVISERINPGFGEYVWTRIDAWRGPSDPRYSYANSYDATITSAAVIDPATFLFTVPNFAGDTETRRVSFVDEDNPEHTIEPSFAGEIISLYGQRRRFEQ